MIRRCNIFFKLNTHCEGEGDQGGGDGGTGGDNNQQQQQNNQQQQSNENNNQNNIIESGTMWDTDSSDEGKQGNNNAQNQNANNQNQNADGGADHFAQHVESLDLAGGIDAGKIMQDMQSGNTESFTAALKQVGESAYKASIKDSNKLVQAQVKKAVEDAVGEANGNFNSSMAIRDLNDQLPYTADPALAPVAKGVFTQFLKKNNTQAEAIKLTDDYFKHTVGLLGGKIDKSNGKPNGNFGNAVDNSGGAADDGNGETDWIDFIGAKPAEA